ncbi:MAG: hypothetical protein M3010_06165 [Candidatus Dormibacteraeota bacterium]|nr:hypothetical protein [Candidatus Dormibacteraeota bacterium]
MTAALQLTGCGPYLFRQSDRVRVTYPGTYSSVREPLTIRWQAGGFSAPQDGHFGVFVDRDPMPPGNGLEYFDRNDRDGIWVVDRTTLSVEVLRRRAGVDPAEQDHHDVTVVLLDRAGHRVGEYAGFSEFNVRR